MSMVCWRWWALLLLCTGKKIALYARKELNALILIMRVPLALSCTKRISAATTATAQFCCFCVRSRICSSRSRIIKALLE